LEFIVNHDIYIIFVSDIDLVKACGATHAVNFVSTLIRVTKFPEQAAVNENLNRAHSARIRTKISPVFRKRKVQSWIHFYRMKNSGARYAIVPSPIVKSLFSKELPRAIHPIRKRGFDIGK